MNGTRMNHNPYTMTRSTSQPDHSAFRYYAAEVARREGTWVPTYEDGEVAIHSDRPLMVALNRDMYANNPIHRSLINSMVTAIIGEDGVEFCPKITKVVTEAVKQHLQGRWLNWCKYADFSKRFNFTELERMVLTEYLVCGEVLLVKRGNQLQLVETERILEVQTHPSTREIIGFVLSDPTKKTSKVTIKASDAIYLSNVDRPSQIRGTGLLWSCVDVIHMLMFILRRSAKAWGLASSYAVQVEAENANSVADALAGAAGGVADDGEADSATSGTWAMPDDPYDRTFVSDDVSMFVGRPGEKVSVVNHNGVPNVQLSEHVMTYLRIISSVIQVDAATFVLSDYSKTSYSSSRAANLALSKVVRKTQNKLQSHLYDKIGLWLLGMWRNDENDPMVPNETEVLNCLNWIMPRPQVIDSKGECEANEKELALGLVTHNELLLSRNKDPQTYYQQRVAEILVADKLVEEIKQKTNGRIIIPWQTLCGLGSSKTAMAEDIAQRNQPAPTEPTPATEPAA